ncbi:MAG: PKD domain-containing protein, partial [Cyanobacteria bacterium J06614_10]
TTITVSKAARQLMDPIAIIDANPTTGLAPLTVSFDGKRSYDPDGGEITSYFWNFAGEKYVEERAPTHTFSLPGTYTVSLTVSDDEDDTNSTRTTISTISIPARQIVPKSSPVVIIKIDQKKVTAPLTIKFDGRDSYDPDGGQIVAYQWDFDGLGKSSSPNPSFSFRTKGTYSISLVVIDDQGEKSSNLVKIVVK